MGTFEFNGEQYAKASRHQKEWGNKLISGLALKGNEAILDLGCGDGALTEQLAQLVPQGSVLGMDASRGMIEAAEKHQRENLRFIHMDMNDMAFLEQFDVIYSNAALHWVQDHQRLLRNAYAALKPGGVITWNFGGEGTCASFCGVMREKMQEDSYKVYFEDFAWPWHMPSKAEYERLTASVGFSTVRVEEENADRYFATADEMIGWMDQPCLVPFIGQLPDGKKELFRREAIDEMLKRTMRDDGMCFETFRRIKVYAVK